MPKAVSLHHHTTYSFLDGHGTPEQHLQRAADLGYSALAFTEHGNTSSHFRAEKAAKKIGSVKPIFGIEAYTASSYGDPQQTKYHLTMLAMNQTGYRNLNLAVTRSWKQHHYHPTMTGADVTEFSDGLTVLSGCSGSFMACTLIGGKRFSVPETPAEKAAAYDSAGFIAEQFHRMMPGRFYIEVQAFPELESTRKINTAYARLSRETGIPLAMTLDCHYVLPSDNEMQVILHACGPQGRGNATADEMLRSWNYDVLLTLPESDKIIVKKLIDTGIPRQQAWEAVMNTADIASRCNVTLPKAERLQFPCPDGWDANELIWEWLRDGWRYRNIGSRSRKEQDWFADRIQYEMKHITEKDFIDFFLATADVVKWCKHDGNGVPIPVGPGRGSAAASVVCWLMEITEIDPARYPGMIFERFIDTTRVDPPDIDLDFADDRRREVLEYLKGKYGPECVGTIANFVRYRGKNSLVDVARVHSVPKQAKDIVSNLIIERSGGDSRFDASLEDTAAMFPNAKAIFDAFPKLWLATRLEGGVRGMSVHAAGLVVANSPITDVCATYERDGRQVLSIDKYDAEYAGMLKMDFLGLTTMGMIARCLELAGLTLEDLYAIPDDDTDTLDVFRRNDVVGIFQIEGRAARIVCRDVCPDDFWQVAAISALCRPGPLFSGTTAKYCDVKHKREKAVHYHSIVDEITKDTFFQIIYQEQILKILQVIGGFEWTDLNEIRRIIAKKIGQAAFQVSMQNFIDGAKRLHGMDAQTAEEIWKHLVTSGTYAFNIAHAVSYSVVSWWCAYLKTHYPVEFFAASLAKSEPGKEKEFKLMRDSIAHGIPVRAPNWHSGPTWQPFTDKSGTYLTAGLTSVPGIADKTAASILRARGEQPFTSWQDMIRAHGVGLKTVESMKQFSDDDDPFGLERAKRIITRVTDAIVKKELRAPVPTHNGNDVSMVIPPKWMTRNKGETLVYVGIVKARIYQDIIENIHSRTGNDLKEIERTLKDNHLTKYCVIQCYDDSIEEVYGRITRYAFPKLRSLLETIEVGHDVVVMRGRKTPFFGNSIAIDDLWVVDPD
ncbi:MAG TPA: DNA polymerase III subunit alpha [Nitrospiraceae bacterium]|nr:DNA polymerase III subunit alpha [Nitrospiraceae bacterium]